MDKILSFFPLFFLPLVFLPFGSSPFEIPKVLIGEAVIAAMVFSRLPRPSLTKSFRKQLKPLTLILILIAVILIGGLLHHSQLTLFGNQFRLQGSFLILNLLIFCLISSQLKLSPLLWVRVGPILSPVQRFENRRQIWETAAMAGWYNQITGTGFGNLEIVLNEAGHQIKTSNQYANIDSAYNLWLDFWAQGGMVAVFALITLVSLAIHNYLKKGDKLNLTLLAGVVTCMPFNPMSVGILIAFWWLIGQSFYFWGFLVKSARDAEVAQW